MGKTKKSRITKKKYSKRKYLNKAKTNRRYSKNKYTRHKHTRHKNTRRKKITKKKLRGGMDAEANLFASVIDPHALSSEELESITEADTIRRELGKKYEASFIHKYTDWYIKDSAPPREKEGRKTTGELKLTKGTVIKYVENLTGGHQWYLSNALVAGQGMLGFERSTEKYGYYENGKIYDAVTNEEGKRVKDPKDTKGQPFDDDFKNRYHIKVVNEGFNIKTDFLNEQYVITFEDDPYNPLVLEFDKFVGETLTIDKYVTSRTMDLYRISMDIRDTQFYSDIRWSSFEKLVEECMEEKDTPSFKMHSELGDCQRDIQEIYDKLKSKKTEWGQSALAVAKGLRRGVAVVGETAQEVGTSLSGLATDLATGMWSGMGYQTEPGPDLEAEPKPESELQAAGVAYELEGNSINADILTLPDSPSSENFATRRFMIVSIARLIKCGFLSIVYKHLDSSQGDSGAMEPEPAQEDKSLVVAGEGSKQLGFFGGALQLAAVPTELIGETVKTGRKVATYAEASARQVAQNIFTGMASEEWVHLQGEIQKELLYERMCSFGKGIDEQIADSIANIANATKVVSKKMGYKDLSGKAEAVGGVVGSYGEVKEAANIAATAFDWWTSLNPTTAATKAATKLAWKSVNVAGYATKIKNNNGKASKPASNLWKSLCLLLAECELDEDDPSNDIIKSQRVLNIFRDYARDEDDPKKLHMDAVLASGAAIGHPGAAVIKKFLEQQRQGGPQPEPQQLLDMEPGTEPQQLEDMEPEPEPEGF
jgi:hypothetical protein